MRGSLPLLHTLATFLLAGALLGAAALHASWWRGADRRSGAGDTLWWSLALGTLCLVNGLVHVAEGAVLVEGLLIVRYLALGAAFLLALPAIRAYTAGPPLLPSLVALSVWFAGGIALALTTDLVVTAPRPGELPTYGVVDPLLTLGPLFFVAAYFAQALRGRRQSALGTIVAGTGALSGLLLVLSTLQPPSYTTEFLRGAWVVPLAIGLEVLTIVRLASLRKAGVRRGAMRDALAAVSNHAWLSRTPEALLERACEEARGVLGDPGLEGSLRSLARERYVVEFCPSDGRGTDDDERAFLRDLARAVAGAAERQAMTGRLRDTAYSDTLTGLPNRTSVDRRLRAVVEAANVERTRVAVIFVDIDGFKHVNDIHGHAWGDRVLVLAAEHLTAGAPDGASTARYGGDEFLVVIERAGPTEELLQLARRLRADFQPQVDDVLRPALTLGVAVWEPGDIVDPIGLVRDADLAMLEAKRSRAGVVLYDHTLDDRFAARRVVRRELEVGIAGWEFVPYFQPITDSRTLEVVGLEALARWRHLGELRHPSQWLSVAEETGLIVEIGKQIFTGARAGSDRFGLPVAVNVAPRQLEDPDLLAHIVESWGDDAWDRLTIELTESASLYDSPHVHTTLETLVAKGAKISLDDFGTGYNSLSRLGELPLHTLKIDQTFVRDVDSPQGTAVIRATLALAAAHGLEVVAEGVERVEQLNALVALGITRVQGYMVGRPSPSLPVRPRDGWWPTRAITVLPETTVDRVPGQIRRAASP